MAVGPSEGLHAFAFIRGVEPGTGIREAVEALWAEEAPDRGPILFASEVVGPYVGFVHLAAEGLPELQGAIADRLWGRGLHAEHAVEWRVYEAAGATFGPKRWSPGFIALVRIWTEPGEALEVLERLGEHLGPPGELFKGASVVFGSFDILLQLGSDDDLAELMDPVLGRLRRVEGIARTETSFAYRP
jgi:hypothetical protein